MSELVVVDVKVVRCENGYYTSMDRSSQMVSDASRYRNRYRILVCHRDHKC
jgi:DNA-binding cell septation regulator SpoVG